MTTDNTHHTNMKMHLLDFSSYPAQTESKTLKIQARNIPAYPITGMCMCKTSPEKVIIN